MIVDVLERLDKAISELELVGEEMFTFDEKLKFCQMRLSKILVKEEPPDEEKEEKLSD